MNADKSFEELIQSLTPLQLDWLSHRIDTTSDRDASRQLGIDKSTPSRWKAGGVPLDAIIAAAKQDGVTLVRRRIKSDLNWAYDVKRAGLKARSEKIRQDAASEILDRGLGKAKQTQEIQSLVKNLDLSALTDSQLERLASGEDVLSVLTTQGGG